MPTPNLSYKVKGVPKKETGGARRKLAGLPAAIRDAAKASRHGVSVHKPKKRYTNRDYWKKRSLEYERLQGRPLDHSDENWSPIQDDTLAQLHFSGATIDEMVGILQRSHLSIWARIWKIPARYPGAVYYPQQRADRTGTELNNADLEAVYYASSEAGKQNGANTRYVACWTARTVKDLKKRLRQMIKDDAIRRRNEVHMQSPTVALKAKAKAEAAAASASSSAEAELEAVLLEMNRILHPIVGRIKRERMRAAKAAPLSKETVRTVDNPWPERKPRS